jgi:hypothetical protein
VKRVILGALAFLSALAWVGPPTATASSHQPVGSNVLLDVFQFEPATYTFRTEVLADMKARCWRRREMKMFRKRDGQADLRVLSARTDRDGLLDLDTPVEAIPPGRYYAQTPPMTTQRFRCLGARSHAVSVPSEVFPTTYRRSSTDKSSVTASITSQPSAANADLSSSPLAPAGRMPTIAPPEPA